MTKRAAPRRAAQKTAPAPSTVLPAFTPWRSFLLVLILLILPLALRFDLGFGAPETLSLSVRSLLPLDSGSWVVAFLERVTASMAKSALTLGALAALGFGLLQILGSGSDLATARRAGRRPGLLHRPLLWLSGRHGVKAPDYVRAAAEWGGDALLVPLRLGVSVFPMLGFIGTVVGLSGAIQNLPDAVTDKSRLQPVLDDLHVAFDTTFIGLVGSLVCIVLVRIVEARIDTLNRMTAS